ncbi:hypothetical protein CEXT_388301 [Caerostris extrusa]|uniref:C2H2-type domain-containing protein n=1 Tax=Caerostris extrusa TaxID=172846 RepID=A0AAV4NS66_CAEEX|nr:hypothetical protein CEXT_388301 [Caerostris extrusa]
MMATPTQSQRSSVTYHVASDLANTKAPIRTYFIIISDIFPSFYLLSCCQRCVIPLDQLSSHLSATGTHVEKHIHVQIRRGIHNASTTFCLIK